MRARRLLRRRSRRHWVTVGRKPRSSASDAVHKISGHCSFKINAQNLNRRNHATCPSSRSSEISLLPRAPPCRRGGQTRSSRTFCPGEKVNADMTANIFDHTKRK